MKLFQSYYDFDRGHDVIQLKVGLERPSTLEHKRTSIVNPLCYKTCFCGLNRTRKYCKTKLFLQCLTCMHNRQVSLIHHQAYSMVAQQNSKAITSLREAAKLNSKTVKTVALVTIVFLPPTFISVVSLFNETRAGRHIEQCFWAESWIAKGEYDEIRRLFQRDNILWYVEDKIRSVHIRHREYYVHGS